MKILIVTMFQYRHNQCYDQKTRNENVKDISRDFCLKSNVKPDLHTYFPLYELLPNMNVLGHFNEELL